MSEEQAQAPANDEVNVEQPATDNSEQETAIDTPEAPQIPAKHKLNIYGKEEEYTIDEVLAHAQKAKAADYRFQEASKLMKEVETFKANPFEALKAAGVPKKEIADFAAQVLEDQLRIENMSEVERKAFELENENKTYKQQLEEQQKAQQQYQQLAQQQAASEIDNQMSEVLSNLGRKPTPKLVARIAEQMLAHLNATGGQQSLDANQALERADHYFTQELTEYYDSTEADQVWSALPEKVQKGIKKLLVQQTKQQDPMGQTWKDDKVTPIKETGETRQPVPGGTDEWFNKIEQKYGS